MTAGNLASSLNYQDKHAEAETMHREVLEVQRRVLGPEHPDTMDTAKNLVTCVRAASVTRGSTK